MGVILVTGGAGYIGSIVAEQLLKKGFQVVVVDNLQTGHRDAVLPGIKFCEADLSDHQRLEDIFQDHAIDAVFHFAAEATVEDSMSDPAKYFLNNVSKGTTLLEIMRKSGCHKLIFSSSAAIFGEPEYTPIDEKHPQNPINAYGESKLMFEKILEWYHLSYGLKFNSFRYFNAAGASARMGEDHKNETHLIPIVINTVLGKRESMKIFGMDYPTKDGTCIRDYIHVIDLARAHILGLKNLEKHPNGKYNLGNGSGFSVLDVIKTVEKVTGSKVNWSKAKRRRGDPAVLIASSELAKKDLEWEPQYQNLEDIIESAWRWHKKNPDGYRKRC